MSDTLGGHGPALVAYLDQLRDGQSVRAFGLERGIDPAQINKWRNGAAPSLDHLRRVADALELTLGEVLIIARFGTREDFTVSTRPPPLPAPPRIADAIKKDPDLSDAEREVLQGVWGALEAARAGRKPSRRRFRIQPS